MKGKIVSFGYKIGEEIDIDETKFRILLVRWNEDFSNVPGLEPFVQIICVELESID